VVQRSDATGVTRDAGSSKPFARRAWVILSRFVDGLFAHNAFETAASIAFWFFLSLIPLLVFAGFLLAQVVRSSGVDAIVGPALEVVPGSADAIIRKELERMAGASSAPIAPLSAVGFLYTASAGLHALMDVFEVAARVKRRPWWKQRAIALGWVLGGLAVLCVTAWVIVKIDSRMHPTELVTTGADQVSDTPTSSPSATPAPAAPRAPRTARVTHPPSKIFPAPAQRLHKRVINALESPGEQSIGALILLIVGVGVLAGFYRFAVEHPAGVRRRAWPGAFAAVGSWLLVSWVFGVYVVSLSSYTVYYGYLAGVAVLLVWLYLSSLSLIVGAEVNCELEGVRAPPQ
jgi:uncharacterized BrkB/YihY/UPF0761 family membrane protein